MCAIETLKKKHAWITTYQFSQQIIGSKVFAQPTYTYVPCNGYW